MQDSTQKMPMNLYLCIFKFNLNIKMLIWKVEILSLFLDFPKRQIFWITEKSIDENCDQNNSWERSFIWCNDKNVKAIGKVLVWWMMKNYYYF